MSILRSVFAYLQYARLKEGHPSSTSPTSGNIVLAVCLTMLVCSITITLYLLLPAFADSIDDLLKDLFGRSSGKTIGRLIGIFLIILIYPIIKFTIGTKEKFDQTMTDFESMSDEDKEKTAKKGKLFFILSISSIAIPLLIGALS